MHLDPLLVLSLSHIQWLFSFGAAKSASVNPRRLPAKYLGKEQGMRNHRLLVAALALASFHAIEARGDSVIDTTGGMSVGSGGWSPIGEPNTATYGMTFTVGSDTVLKSFNMYLTQATGPVDFTAYVMAWDGTKATGPILYQSPDYTFNDTVTTGYTFTTGNLNLVQGQQYVAFLNTSNHFDGVYTTASMPLANVPYAGGGFAFYNNGSNFGALTTHSWDAYDAQDVAFKATFGPAAAELPSTPLPTTACAGLALMGGAVFQGRRRK